jgi:hypothetical protein
VGAWGYSDAQTSFTDSLLSKGATAGDHNELILYCLDGRISPLEIPIVLLPLKGKDYWQDG